MEKWAYIILLFSFVLKGLAQSADEEVYIPTDTIKKIPLHPSTKNAELSLSLEEEEEEDDDDDDDNEDEDEDEDNEDDDEDEDKNVHREIANLYGDFDNTTIHQYKYKEVFQTRDSVVLLLDKEKFVLPVQGPINSHYGWRRYRPHYGTDIDLEKGDSVRSAFDGIVRYAHKKAKGYGQVIVIRHYNGLETVYGHLSKILVHPNDTIKAGDVIGLGGSTGRSTGPHLHFEIRCLGLPINSEDIIDYENKCLKTTSFVLTKKDVEETYNLRSKKYRHLYKERTVYIVKKGDTLSKIAKKTGLSLSALLKKNKLKKTSVIKPGMRIYL